MNDDATRPFDSAELLGTEEAVAAYIEAALEDGDPALIRRAIGVVARARGMSEISKASGLSRESLYKALSADGNPAFETMTRVLKAIGLRLTARPIEESNEAPTKIEPSTISGQLFALTFQPRVH